MTQALCRLNDLDFENLTPTFLKQVVQLLVKTMIGEEIARELVDVVSVEYGATVNRLLAAIHDRASVNGVAMKTITIDTLPFNGMYVVQLNCYVSPQFEHSWQFGRAEVSFCMSIGE